MLVKGILYFYVSPRSKRYKLLLSTVFFTISTRLTFYAFHTVKMLEKYFKDLITR